MQQFQINGIDDLVSNQSFKRWVLLGNKADGIYWQHWIAENPDKLEWLAAAKQIIQILAGEQSELPAERVYAAAAKILSKIHELPIANDAAEETADDLQEQYVLRLINIKRTFRWLVAASIIAAIAVSVFVVSNNRQQLPPDAEAAMFKAGPGDFFFQNNADSVQHITLSDGSSIALYKGSRLRFSSNIDSARREVYLSGSAFFSVAHNPSKPFIVYTKTIVTKVLGTSFSIKAVPSETTAVIAVVTGKVSVFKKETFTAKDARPGILEGVVVTPNQQASYEAKTGTISKALVNLPVAIGKGRADSVFDATPAVAVFKKLQDYYGIPIIMDEAALASCSINASFKRNETFYERISIICQTINASYEIVDASIVVSSKGCK